MNYVAPCGIGMKNLFSRSGTVISNSLTDITKTEFSNAMQNTFKNAKPLDICYLYCASHGNSTGLALFKGSNAFLTPEYLRSQIDLYKGTFAVFISGCHSGTYISNNTNNINLNENTDFFDADIFVNSLISGGNYYKTQSTNLSNSIRIKVLCSSHSDELSYSTNYYATNYWCLGCGYDYRTDKFIDFAADSNWDNRVSLNELFVYSYNQINTEIPKQHVVCYPESDNFIIYECNY